MEVDSQVVAVATASTDVIFKEVAHGFLLKYLSISKQPETPNQRSFLSWGECSLLADSRLLGTLHQRAFCVQGTATLPSEADVQSCALVRHSQIADSSRLSPRSPRLQGEY